MENFINCLNSFKLTDAEKQAWDAKCIAMNPIEEANRYDEYLNNK